MDTLLVHLSLLAYAASAAAYLAWLARPDPRRALAGRWLLCGGLAVHLCALAVGGIASLQGRQQFSLLAALVTAGYLLLDRRGELPVVGAFVAPLVVAVMVPAHLVAASEPRPWSSGTLYVHVAAATLGTAALTLAFALAALYLLSERQAKSRRPGRLFARLTSLEAIDRTGYRLAVWGFILLSLAIGTGSLVASSTPSAAAKLVFAFLTWLLLAAMIEARIVAGWRGRRAALLVVVGFTLLAGAYASLFSAAPAMAIELLP